ncbi:PAC2 family protein [Aeromicrobium sp. SMF47]|uniref:PAC2 family protein n=1 Tax=Aeromicrobium yanjiei TaxID=2662028 RepID=A0A5Q2MDT7_9ACTN|nr:MULTISPECIES: PAC2 family protein [Aeromicrobium]MRJ77636.1 PAC2 family protein [Aeromicrobium yanjiei]MRK02004.1 PAC2 family protein [Aeromicrobium sp. S22]QGG41267.1 PAC2 family protein [Aeromicrobium yanjiei]
MAMKNWRFRRTPDQPRRRDGSGPVLIHALDGFLGAGSAARLAAAQLRTDHGEVIHEFDVDEMLDYRARRPMIGFRENHYADYDEPKLQVVLEHDANGVPYFLLAGPEPDFQWERFVADVHDLIEEHDVPLTLGLGAVPMGVPHTRPAMITAHGTRPELVDRQNLWSAQVTVPSSAQSLLEYRLGQWGHDAAGYVVHVPHYLAQIDYPTAALALIDALVDRTGLAIDVDALRARQGAALLEIEQQIEEQGGKELLGGLEEQYDAFTRGAAQSLLASDEDLPSGDELADQFEQFLARQRKNDQG